MTLVFVIRPKIAHTPEKLWHMNIIQESKFHVPKSRTPHDMQDFVQFRLILLSQNFHVACGQVFWIYILSLPGESYMCDDSSMATTDAYCKSNMASTVSQFVDFLLQLNGYRLQQGALLQVRGHAQHASGALEVEIYFKTTTISPGPFIFHLIHIMYIKYILFLLKQKYFKICSFCCQFLSGMLYHQALLH